MNQISVVILAGSRPGGDPLAHEFGVTGKAFITLNGQTMLSHVIGKFISRADIKSIHIVTQLGQELRDNPDTGWMASSDRIQIHESQSTIALSLTHLIDGKHVAFPALITTADNALINGRMIDQLLAQASGSDVAIGLVEKQTLLAKYPTNQRTWLKLRGGQYSGANLFFLGSGKAQKMIDLWAHVEQDRKKGWKIFTLFGPVLLFLAVTRLISLNGLGRRLSKKLDLKISASRLDQAEACMDVDKAADVKIAERILKARE